MSIGGNKVIGIKVPRDLDAILLGAGALFAILCIPTIGDAVVAGASAVRGLFGGK